MDFLSKEKSLRGLEEIPQKVILSLLRTELSFISNQTSFIDYHFYHTQAKMLGCSLSFAKFQEAGQALLFVLNWLNRNNPLNDGRFTLFNILITHTSLQEAAVDVLNDEYSKTNGKLSKADVLGGYQLLGIDWGASVSTASDDCGSIGLPLLTLQLTLGDPQTGEVVTRNMVLSQREYEGLLKEARKINSIMHTL